MPQTKEKRIKERSGRGLDQRNTKKDKQRRENAREGIKRGHGRRGKGEKGRSGRQMKCRKRGDVRGGRE